MDYVLIHSGGLDSSVLLYEALNRKHVVKALSFDYGQRHRKEIYSAQLICQRLHVPHEIVNLANLRSLLPGSSQTDNAIEVPEGHYAAENMKLTVVPNRNMIMMSIAAGHAIALGYHGIGYAAHAGDHTIYPDCRPVFVGALQNLLDVVDFKPVQVWAPFLHMTKAEIVKLGRDLKVPFELTWSCYKGGYLHCGKCGTCVERKEAFKLAGVDDPTKYLEDMYEVGPQQ